MGFVPRAAIALLLWLSFACETKKTSRTIQIDLDHRKSCGSSTLSYDTTCIASMVFRLVDTSNTILKEMCVDISDRFTNINELLNFDGAIDVLSGVNPTGSARLEFQAYHAFDKAACSNLSDADLMLWGASEFFELSDASLSLIALEFECRPSCDCADIDNTCSQELEVGVCAPTNKRLPCQRACEDDGECYGGLLQCTENVCADPDAMGVCTACTQSSDCTSNYCVTRVEDTTETICLGQCPPASGVGPCPGERMSCRRLDGVKFIHQP